MTFTGDTGDWRNLGDSGAGTPGSGFPFSPQLYRSVGARLDRGTGFRRGGLVDVLGGDVGGEVVMAAMGGGEGRGALVPKVRPVSLVMVCWAGGRRGPEFVIERNG